MTSRTSTFFIAFLLLVISSCSKPGPVASDGTNPANPNDTTNPANPTNPTNPTNPANPDSTFILTEITGSPDGYHLRLDYDNNNNLIKFYHSYSWALNDPCYVKYEDGKPSLIISEYNADTKASAVFQYGSNSKISKVYYKNPRGGLSTNDPYFSNLNDGNLHEVYDSLVYSATNQLQAIYEMNTISGNSEPYQRIEFYYASSSDSVANRLEEYHYDDFGNSMLYDQLLVTTNAMDNPACTLMPYFPFVFRATFLSGSGGNVMLLPLLYNNPSSGVKLFLPLAVPKCITNYKVYNNWGSYNYTNTIFNYAYTSDSLKLISNTSNNTYGMQYWFKKRPR